MLFARRYWPVFLRKLPSLEYNSFMRDSPDRQQPVSKPTSPRRSLKFDEEGRISRRGILGLGSLALGGLLAGNILMEAEKDTPGVDLS